MHLYNKIYQDFFFQGLDLFRGRQTVNRLKFLRKSQFWDKKRLQSWQLKKLNSLLETARTSSPFHSTRLHPITLPLTNLKQLQNIPILSKKELRDNYQKILCTNISPKDCELSKTGGSTGEPSFYYLDKNSKNWNRGSVYRSAEWAGVYLGDKTVQMAGSHYDFHEFQKLKWRVIFFLQRYRDMSVAQVNDELFDKYYHEIMNFKPSSIWGYASGLYLFSQFVEKNHPGSRFNFIKGIITSSETLRPHMRTKINEIFGANKVYDHYGSREMYIASECRMHHGYHIHAENIILEVVDNKGLPVPHGQLGKILVTDLSNLAFPFLRYEIGDVGVMSDRDSCECGVTLPILERIEGRIADIVVLKNRTLTPPNFTILMSDIEGIDAYQIVQEAIDHLNVKIVRNDHYDERIDNYLQGVLRELTGPDVSITFDFVQKISVPKSGKRRYIISKISDQLL